MVATGNYINVFNNGYDVFVILNEPNDEPTPDDVDAVVTVVEEVLMDRDISNKSQEIENRLNEANINCVSFDCQVLVIGRKGVIL